MLVDTHAHLDFPEFVNDLDSVLERAKESGVHKIITIGISISTSHKAIHLAKKYADIFATVGIHPHGARDLSEQDCAEIRGLAKSEKVVAIGEIGLDYYRDRQPRAVQRRCMRKQLEVACEMKLPAVFHVRDAYGDFLEIVQDYSSALHVGVMHCFSGDWETAIKCLDLGFYLSLPGTVTFPKAQYQRETAGKAPLDRLLLETDAPFLAPVPYRGKVNEPSFLAFTAREVANLRGCGWEEVAEQTTNNARMVFSLP
jgi:TatD DNase family protein